MPSRKTLANAIRFLSIDAIQKANSGHPGMPMGMADIAEVLWNDFLRHNPRNPLWLDRDRFILSNGHGSMLQYALLHLSGYDLSIKDLKEFRQLYSKTPGHPEVGCTPGVEATTGPLGQGIAYACGMALAEQLLAKEFNRTNHKIIDHYTYCFLGDGCLMEGISHEACSLAGTLEIGKLIAFWDDNGISIDGKVQPWFSEDTATRFRSYGWHVISDIDGHDHNAIHKAIKEAQATMDKPSLICCKTEIGHGSPNLVNTAACHGAPLGEQEIMAMRATLGWTDKPFSISNEIYDSWDAKERGSELELEWNKRWEAYQDVYPELAKSFQRRMQGVLPVQWTDNIENICTQMQENNKPMATRKASQQILEKISQGLPELLGGSADLSCSNLTNHKYSQPIAPGNIEGNYVYYGVREFGMSAMMTGISLHRGLIPYGGTFLTFLDYAKNAVRMSALMRQRAIYVYTHDSIGLGEDGPTHQPIEHLAMLRVTPNVSLWRPCDGVETAFAWRYAIERTSGPTCLALSRQTLVGQPRTTETMNNILKGGYIIKDSEALPHAIIIATGSEVEIALAANKVLKNQGIYTRVVSMPSVDVFIKQDSAYQESVIPPRVTARVAVEAGATAVWHRFTGLTGQVVGIDQYGESAPAADIYKAASITADAVIRAVQITLEQNKAH